MQIKNPSRYALGNMEDLMQSKRMKAVIAVLMLGFAGLLVNLFNVVDVLPSMSLSLLDPAEKIGQVFLALREVFKKFLEIWDLSARQFWLRFGFLLLDPTFATACGIILLIAFFSVAGFTIYDAMYSLIPTAAIILLFLLSFGSFSALSCMTVKKNINIRTATFVKLTLTAIVLCFFPGTMALTAQIVIIGFFVIRYVFCLNRREVNPNIGFNLLRTSSVFMFLFSPVLLGLSDWMLDFYAFGLDTEGLSADMILGFGPSVLVLMLISVLCFYLSYVMEGRAAVTGFTRFAFLALTVLLFLEIPCLNWGVIQVLSASSMTMSAPVSLICTAVFFVAWQIALVLLASILISLRPKKV